MTIFPAFLSPRPFILAPLAGYTDIVFRLLCREAGAACCFSEMVSCHGLVYGQRNTLALTRTLPPERPVVLQLFGAEPEVMAQAAARIDPLLVDGIDINMGCPVRKVVKRGAGCALMRDPDRACRIIEAVRQQTSLPVSVKIRSGWTEKEINAPDFARQAEAAGAELITIHGRTWAQAFGGHADPAVIAAVKAAVSVPVIGNGDILSYQDGLKLMEQTGCDGVMIGRGALGNPWVFQAAGRPATLEGRLPMITRHIELGRRLLPEPKVIHRLKHHVHRYLTGLHGATLVRQAITACSSCRQLEDLLLHLATATDLERAMETMTQGPERP